MESRSKGFSLLELMVALTVAGVVLGIAAPSFNEFRRNNRLTGAANDLLSAAQIARTEAIKRQVPVSVCATPDPSDPDAACVLGEYRSWIVFVDTNSDCDRAGADEVLVKADGPLDDNVLMNSNGTCISFGANGFLQPQAITGVPTASRTLYCDDRGLAPMAGNQSSGRGIFITNTGRSRVSRDVTSGTTNDIGTWGMTCP